MRLTCMQERMMGRVHARAVGRAHAGAVCEAARLHLVSFPLGFLPLSVGTLTLP